MINAKESAEKYCLENGLPVPSGKDFGKIGVLASKRFKFLYVQKSGLRGYIDGSGLMRIKEGNQAVIVFGYPDDFQEEMSWVINKYYDQKKEKADEEERRQKEAAERALKPKRPRIPAGKSIPFRR
jgi:hypothetical protein